MKTRSTYWRALVLWVLTLAPFLSYAALPTPTADTRFLPPNATITGPITACNGSQVTVCVNGNASGTQYDWSIDPGNGSILNFSGTNMDCVTFTADGTLAVIEVVVTDNFGTQTSGATEILIEDCCAGNTYTWFSESLSNVFGSGPTTLTGQTITIDGPLTIDSDLTLEQCTVNLRPNASIQVSPGHTFTIRGTTLKACANELWSGIYLMDPTALFISAEHSVIQDAFSAVESHNGGNFQIEETTFDRNYSSINVLFFNGNHPGSIKSSRFMCSAPLLSPYAGRISEVGIYAGWVDHLQIGDPSSPDNANEFRTLNSGIRGRNAGLDIFNNVFSNIQSFPNNQALHPGVAISAYTEYIFTTKYVTVGGPGLNSNRIENSKGGIHVNSNQEVLISNNTLRNITDEAIRASYIPDRNLEIIQNQIHDFGHGIYLSSLDFGTVKVIGNTLNNTDLTSTTQHGIFVSGGTTNGESLLVVDNEITNVKAGIFVSKMPNNRIMGNTVHYNLTQQQVAGFNGIRTGIEVASSFNSLIEGNEVTNSSPSNIPTLATEAKLKGIKLLDSEHSSTRENKVFYMGRGFEFLNALGGSTEIRCNQAESCWTGMQFLFTAIGNQGAPNMPSGNIWVNNIGPYRTAVLSTPASTWYTGTTPEESPLPSNTSNIIQMVTAGVPACLWANKTAFETALEPTDALAIHLYPNPNHGHFTLEVEGMTTPGTLQIINTIGQQVHQQQLANGDLRQLTTPELPQGIYWLQVETEGQILSHKLIIQ